MDVMIDTVISKFKYCKNPQKSNKKMVLNNLKEQMTKSPLQTSLSIIYCNDKTFLKIFKLNVRNIELFKTEYKTYKSLEKIPELEQYIPKMLDSSNNYHGCNKNFILLENRGIDGIELSNNMLMTFDGWKRFLVDISYALKILHKNNITHCDIKPENVTFDNKKKLWSLIDFGFAGRQEKTNKFVGTIPYCSPHTFHPVIQARTSVTSTKHNLKFVGDIYSFAMSALVMFGYTHSREGRFVRFDITHIIGIYNGTPKCFVEEYIPKNAINNEWTRKVLKILAAIILTQVDTTCRIAQWDSKLLSCSFIGHNTMSCHVKYNIHEYWDEFNTIIENYNKI